MKAKTILFFLSCLCAVTGSGHAALAQEIHEDYRGTYRAQVLRVSQAEQDPEAAATHPVYRNADLRLLTGPDRDKEITIRTDHPRIREGQKVFVNHIVHVGGTETYAVTNIDRTGQIYLLIALFVLSVVLLGGWQGVRSLLSLGASFLAIFHVLLPLLLRGWNPLITSVVVASLVLFFAIFFTHGYNRESVVAYAGTMCSVLLTGILAILSVCMTDLSGMSGAGSAYLNISTGGVLDFTGLLLGAIVIGALGVLDDIAVTQAAIVSELYGTDPDMSRTEAYRRAMRIGREHVGALVNTLILAYVGTALPFLMLFKTRGYEFATAINLEVFTTEIVRAIVGSIGLIMTVPIVTLFAVHFIKGHGNPHAHGHHH